MHKKSPWLLTVLALALGLAAASCKPQQSVEEKQRLVTGGSLDASLAYTAEEIGWKTTLPTGWNITKPEDTAKMTEMGKQAMEKTSGVTIDASGLKHLVTLKKDQFNQFTSTIEPYNPAEAGPHADNQKMVKDLILDAFKDMGVKVGKVTDGKVTVDGMDFVTLEIEITNPKDGSVLMTQRMYNRLIAGYDFAMTIFFNNQKDRDALTKMAESSTFSKRS